VSAQRAPQSGWEKMQGDGISRSYMTAQDYMMQAIALARPWLGRTSPNPPVGAVLVDATGRVISTGVHRRAGTPHAEVEALSAAGDAARGATLYVTLEPCNHTGRTGPCTAAILEAGVSQVVFGAHDPNPNVAGGGARFLQERGVDVSQESESEAGQLIRFFSHQSRTGRPWVTTKTAMSLDGRTATRTGASKWISGPGARMHAHRFRAEVDAILVGVGTVLADDPALTARSPNAVHETLPVREPLRIVLDSTCRMPPVAAVARRGTLVATTARAAAANCRQLEETGCEVLVLPTSVDGTGRVDVVALLEELGRRGVLSVLVEGGAEVHGTFFDSRLVQEVHAYVAPMIIGGAAAPGAVAGRGAERIRDAFALNQLEIDPVGRDLFIRGFTREASCFQES